MLEFFAMAEVPYYSVSRQGSGSNPPFMWSDNPYITRHTIKTLTLTSIKHDFCSGNLTLLAFYTKRPIPITHTHVNPLEQFIAFDEFVRYAKSKGIIVQIENESYFKSSLDDVFLTAREIAELILKSGDIEPTDDNILKEAWRWINHYCLSGMVIWDTKPIEQGQNKHAPDLEALANHYLIELKSAIELAEVLKKPAAYLLEALREHEAEKQSKLPETVPDGGVDSQTTAEPASTKAIQAKSNELDFSGLLNIPRKKDDWFRVIDDITIIFHTQNGKIPNEAQAWARLWTSPPEGYEITTSKDRGDDCLAMPGSKSLSKRAFNERWKKYTA